MSSLKKVLVVGCGGIGGVIAARLLRAGIDVTAVTGNAEIQRALTANGYQVTEFEGETWTVPAGRTVVALAADDPGGYDVCFVATKATTLVDAVRAAAPHLAPDAPVVVCQNGLPEELAASVVGASRVLGCVVVWGATMSAPGVYERTSKGGFQLGRISPMGGPAPEPVARLLEHANPVTLVEDLAAVRWSKLAINCATSTLGAIGGQRLGPLMRRRFVRRLTLELWTEFVAVARAAGVKLAPVGGTLDIEKLALTTAERAMTLGSPKLAVKHSILIAVGMKYRRLRSSMLVAIERGRTPEIAFLNGEIVRRGRALGVATPVNTRLVEMVGQVAAGQSKPSLALLRSVYDDVMNAPATTTRLAA